MNVAVDLVTSIQYLFSKKSKLALDPDNLNYTINELSTYAAKCEILFKKISDIRYSIFQTILFTALLFQTKLPKSIKNQSIINGPFGSNDLFGSILWGWFLFTILYLFCLFVFLVLVIFVAKNKKRFSTYHEFVGMFRGKILNNTIAKSLPNVWRSFVIVIFIFWGCQFLFDVNFTIAGQVRALSGLEFVYFFLMTFTTVGFGDILPFGNSGYIFIIFIHLFTLYSIIYVFNKLSCESKKETFDDHLQVIKDKHLKRLEAINSYLSIGDEDDSEKKVVCPKGHKLKPHSANGCKLCAGTRFVNPRKVIVYATWPEVDFYKIVSNMTGKTKSELLKIFSTNNKQ